MSNELLEGRYSLPSTENARGGHASLYKAFDIISHSHVAVKVFHEVGKLDDRVLRLSWQNELSVYDKLQSKDNLAELYDFGHLSTTEQPYIVFQWLEGDLWDYLERNSINDWQEFWPIARDILRGLRDLHNADFVHRDIKPENILHDQNGVQKVADFGTTRLVEVMNFNQTMRMLGTKPYAPPEISTMTPTFSYDLYSFAVLVVACLSEDRPQTAADVLESLNKLSIPERVREILSSCLEFDPEDRPESGEHLLAQLEEAQGSIANSEPNNYSLYLDLAQKVVQDLAEILGVGRREAESRVAQELAGTVYSHYDDKRTCFEFCTDTLLLKMNPDNYKSGVFRVLTIRTHNPELSDKARNKWLRVSNFKFVFSVPIINNVAIDSLDEFKRLIHEHAQEATLNSASGKYEFSSWRNVLQVKFDQVKQSGTEITYRSWEKSGNRIHFKVEDTSRAEVGESRLVRVANRPKLFGEIESITDKEIIVYLERFETQSLPKTGNLEIDSQATLSKLRKEQDAVMRVSEGRTANRRMRDILVRPEDNGSPELVESIHYIQNGLDDAKKAAVKKALGADEFLLVQGPPGTGKTTFIAELIAQELKRDPNTRILLTSQTHIALDNALERIVDLCPESILVRIGRQEKLADEISHLALASVLSSWSGKVVEAGSRFISDYAAERGIDLSNPGLGPRADALESSIDNAVSIEKRMKDNSDARSVISQKIEKQVAMAERLLNVALRLEGHSNSQDSVNELSNAAEEFVQVGLQTATFLENNPVPMKQLAALDKLATELNELKNRTKCDTIQMREDLLRSLRQQSSIDNKELIELARKRQPEHHPEISKLQGISKEWAERFGQSPEFNAIVLSESNVVATTCVGLGAVRGSEAIEFDLCILDEASKATATESLVPMTSARRWVLVGDQKQLPPFIEHALQDPKVLNKYELTEQDLKQTLFDHLCEYLPDHSKILLTHQHRMNPIIGNLVSRCFYDGQLTSEPRTVSKAVELALGSPVLWASTRTRKDRKELAHGSSYINMCEVRVVQNILIRINNSAKLSNEKFKVAVLSGYEAQRK